MDNSLKEKYKIVGLNIAYHRKLRGLSQMQLAEMTGISRTHMSRIETAECAVSLDVMFKIAESLEVGSDVLFKGTD